MGANEKYEAAMHGAPTTQDIREEYRNGRQFGELYSKTDFRAEFDRWLVSVRAEAKAEAWDEGCAAGLDSGLTAGEHVLGIKTGRIPAPPANPYKDAP